MVKICEIQEWQVWRDVYIYSHRVTLDAFASVIRSTPHRLRFSGWNKQQHRWTSLFH